MPIRETLDRIAFNTSLELPFQLRLADFELALQDVYDFFYDVNLLFEAGIESIYAALPTETTIKEALRGVVIADVARIAAARTPGYRSNGMMQREI